MGKIRYSRQVRDLLLGHLRPRGRRQNIRFNISKADVIRLEALSQLGKERWGPYERDEFAQIASRVGMFTKKKAGKGK